MARISDFVRNESGLTAIEYGLLAGLVTVCVVAAAATVGSSLSQLLLGLGSRIDVPIGTGSGPNLRCEGNCQ